MENGKNNLRNLGFLGIALFVVAILLTPLNDGFFLFVKRVLLVGGYVLCIVSTVFTLINKKGELVEFFSGLLSDSRLVKLSVFQIIGGLLVSFLMALILFYSLLGRVLAH